MFHIYTVAPTFLFCLLPDSVARYLAEYGVTVTVRNQEFFVYWEGDPKHTTIFTMAQAVHHHNQVRGEVIGGGGLPTISVCTLSSD